MKKLFFALALLITITGNSQVKEGVITYKVEAVGQASPLASMMGKLELVLSFKDRKSLMDMHSGMFTSKTLVNDSGVLVLMNAVSQKFFIRIPKATIAAADTVSPKIEYTNETRDIAGYPCKKAVITVQAGDAGVKQTVWYTDKLESISFGNDQLQLKGLKGMPLEYEMNIMQMQLKLTALKVSTDPVPDTTFVLSTDGYQQMDMNSLQGGGQNM